MEFLDSIAGFVGDIAYFARDAVRGEPRRRRGDVLDFAEAGEYYLTGIDSIEFEGVIGTGGTVTTQPATRPLPSDRIYEITGVYGYSTNPQNVGIRGMTVQWQITISKDVITLFTAAQSFGPLITTFGSNCPPRVWPGGSRIIVPGSVLQCTYTMNTGTISWGGTQEVLGLGLVCNTYKKRG